MVWEIIINMKTTFLDLLWLLILIAIGSFLFSQQGGYIFSNITQTHPIMMGFIKFAILATMGEFLARRIVQRRWTYELRWYQRSLVWGFLGVLLAYVFPIYSAGIDYLVSISMLPVFNEGFLNHLSLAFWKSFWMNILFAFPMMTFHRITDTLIDRGKLFSKWPFMNVWNGIDWNNMWNFVAPSVLWFWIPAHTVTFCLPKEYRLIMAAGLSMCLGAILSFAKKRSSVKM